MKATYHLVAVLGLLVIAGLGASCTSNSVGEPTVYRSDFDRAQDQQRAIQAEQKRQAQAHLRRHQQMVQQARMRAHTSAGRFR